MHNDKQINKDVVIASESQCVDFREELVFSTDHDHLVLSYVLHASASC